MSKLEPTRTYSNPTANDILRRMLDERGVEHEDKPNFIKWDDAGQYQCFAFETFERQGLLRVHCNLTPEQAIAATLGTGTCHNVNHGLTFVCSECGANVDTASSIGYSYVDEFGKRWYGVSNDYGLNYCPNCGAKVVYE